MASVLETKINRIDTNVKNALAAIADKGVTVPEGSNSDSLAALIAAIEAGGGVSQLEVFTLVPSEDVNNSNTITVSHSLGKLPNLFVVFTYDAIEKSSYGVQFSVAYVPVFIVGSRNTCYFTNI